jgi:hypothetical protein
MLYGKKGYFNAVGEFMSIYVCKVLRVCSVICRLNCRGQEGGNFNERRKGQEVIRDNIV